MALGKHLLTAQKTLLGKGAYHTGGDGERVAVAAAPWNMNMKAVCVWFLKHYPKMLRDRAGKDLGEPHYFSRAAPSRNLNKKEACSLAVSSYRAGRCDIATMKFSAIAQGD